MAATKKVAATRGKSTGEKNERSPGIGRSAITGRFMSVAAAKAHKKTAIVQGAGRKLD